MATKSECGQSALEYILLILLFVLVVVAIWSALIGGPDKFWAVVRQAVKN